MYNRAKAIEYAVKWADARSPAYANFAKLGGDCTNFVSQVLHTGGIPMNFDRTGWYYINLNSRAPAWSGVNEFYNFAIKNKSQAGVRVKEVDIGGIEEGDIVQINNGTRFYHSLVITKIINRTTFGILICSHDVDSKNRRLSTYNFKGIRFLHVLN